MQMTEKLHHYIQKNHLSIKKISHETGIDGDVIEQKAERPLNATELLVLCNYLKVNPWDFFVQ